MRRVFRKVKFLLIKGSIYIASFFLSIIHKEKVAIVSCDEYKGKILEDIRLKYYLAKKHIKANIISWEDEKDIKKYDKAIIRSIWGYDNNYFKEWLNKLEELDIKIINTKEIILNNFSKKDQFDILDKYNINHIETNYVYNDNNVNKNLVKLLNKYGKIVVKPHISESGRDTYLFEDKKEIENFDSAYIHTNLFLVQPFIESISDGEISIIVIGNEISHIIRRFPGVLSEGRKSQELHFYDNKMLEIVSKIKSIEEYSEKTFMRIDLIKEGEDYSVLEIELIDPILFFDTINDSKKRKSAYENFVENIKQK